jgi:hypothetical protein
MLAPQLTAVAGGKGRFCAREIHASKSPTLCSLVSTHNCSPFPAGSHTHTRKRPQEMWDDSAPRSWGIHSSSFLWGHGTLSLHVWKPALSGKLASLPHPGHFSHVDPLDGLRQTRWLLRGLSWNRESSLAHLFNGFSFTTCSYKSLRMQLILKGNNFRINSGSRATRSVLKLWPSGRHFWLMAL